MQENNSQLLIYQTENGETKLDVRLEDETVWLPQKAMAELFQVTLPTINEQYLVFATGQAMRRIPMYMKDWIAKLSTISSLSGTFGIPTWQSRYPKMPKEPSIPSLPITQMTEKYIAAKIKDDKIWNRRPAYNSRYIPVKIRSNEQIIRN